MSSQIFNDVKRIRFIFQGRAFLWPKLFALIMLVQSTQVLGSDDPLKDLRQINLTYANASSYEVSVTVQMVNDDGDVVMTQHGSSLKSADGYLREYNGNIALINKECMIAVLASEQKIIYDRNRGELSSSDLGSDEMAQMVEEIIGSTGAEYRYLETQTDNRTIEITGLSGPYDRVLISFVPGTFHLTAIEYEFPTHAGSSYSTVVITYSKMALDIDIDPIHFDESKYISKKGKGIEPSSAFKDYTIIDQSEYEYHE